MKARSLSSTRRRVFTDGPDAGEIDAERVWPLDVLVVDDDAVGRRALAAALRVLGHTCREAGGTAEALDALARQRSDVVVCDWEMPDQNGIELCRRTRERRHGDPSYVYFILMTGHRDQGRLLRAMEAGADDFQRKPLDLDELEARLVLAGRVVALHRRLAAQAAGLRRDSHRLYLASHTDTLTGVGNRLALDEELERLLLERARYGRRASLAMCDVDFFKQYNDTFGHIAGDDVLRRIAQTLKAELRASDRVHRYGGEEFVVLLPEQGEEEAIRALDRVRRAVERLAIASAGPLGHLTFSAGVVGLEPGTPTGTEWLRHADEALYRAKTRGRNRVVGWHEPADRGPLASAG